MLGPAHFDMTRTIIELGDETRTTEAALNSDDGLTQWADWIVSFGYRHIIHPSVLAQFGSRAINLHISMLPWNRGADPNLWSFLEDTPKGVSIHYLDSGIDTGKILVQREVLPTRQDTLRTSYERLLREIESLFIDTWPAIRSGKKDCRQQDGSGSFHVLSDRKRFQSYLTEGWETPVKKIVGLAKKIGNKAEDKS